MREFWRALYEPRLDRQPRHPTAPGGSAQAYFAAVDQPTGLGAQSVLGQTTQSACSPEGACREIARPPQRCRMLFDDCHGQWATVPKPSPCCCPSWRLARSELDRAAAGRVMARERLPAIAALEVHAPRLKPCSARGGSAAGPGLPVQPSLLTGGLRVDVSTDWWTTWPWRAGGLEAEIGPSGYGWPGASADASPPCSPPLTEGGGAGESPYPFFLARPLDPGPAGGLGSSPLRAE